MTQAPSTGLPIHPASAGALRIGGRSRQTFVALLSAGFLCFASPRLVTAAIEPPPPPSKIYAHSIKRMIVKEALEVGVSPALALAVGHIESAFRPKMRSRKGARGVMQVMPDTARGEFRRHPNDLWLPEDNIEIGVAFLKKLLVRYRDERLALSHYNGGRSTNAREQAKIWRGTQNYIRKVQTMKKYYQANIDRWGLAIYLNDVPVRVAQR